MRNIDAFSSKFSGNIVSLTQKAWRLFDRKAYGSVEKKSGMGQHEFGSDGMLGSIWRPARALFLLLTEHCILTPKQKYSSRKLHAHVMADCYIPVSQSKLHAAPYHM